MSAGKDMRTSIDSTLRSPTGKPCPLFWEFRPSARQLTVGSIEHTGITTYLLLRTRALRQRISLTPQRHPPTRIPTDGQTGVEFKSRFFFVYTTHPERPATVTK